MGFRTFVKWLLCDCWSPHWQHKIFKTLPNFIGFSNCALIYLMNWLKCEHLALLNAINESEIRMKSQLIRICVQSVQIMLHAFKPLPFQCQKNILMITYTILYLCYYIYRCCNLIIEIGIVFYMFSVFIWGHVV